MKSVLYNSTLGLWWLRWLPMQDGRIPTSYRKHHGNASSCSFINWVSVPSGISYKSWARHTEKDHTTTTSQRARKERGSCVVLGTVQPTTILMSGFSYNKSAASTAIIIATYHYFPYTVNNAQALHIILSSLLSLTINSDHHLSIYWFGICH